PDTALFREIKNIGLYKVTGMDGAESKQTAADYTTIVTVGATSGPEPNVYLLDVKREKWTTKEGAGFLLSTFEELKQHKTIVESRVKDNKHKTGGDALIVEIREQERIYKKYVNLYPVRPVADKVTRALHIQPLIQDGRFFVNYKDPSHVGLVNEMTMFDGSGTYHDDRVDGLGLAITEIINRAGTVMDGNVTSAIGDNW
ncbi:MAG: phage terminase large subunit, partial [Candidatus Peribacteraceae bacterium]|nr:phage terminase large subunit [Candidatus Peribacteraceae bacterium]